LVVLEQPEGIMEKINYNQEDLEDHHGVCAVIKDEDGRILMQNHIKYGFWTIPVGKVKIGQDIQEGLKQEIFEECGLIIEDTKELVAKNYKYERNGKTVNVFSHLFEIIKYSGVMENKEPEKHAEQKFMELEQIKNLPYLSDLTLLYLSVLGIKRNAKL